MKAADPQPRCDRVPVGHPSPRRPRNIPGTVRPRASRPSAWRVLGSVVVASAACSCVDQSPQAFQHAPFLINRSTSQADVSVTWILRKVACGTAPETLAAALDSGDLDDPRLLTLERGQVAALDGLPRAGVSPVGNCSGSGLGGECVAAILQTEHAAPVLMVATRAWSESKDHSFSCGIKAVPVSLCAPMRDPTLDAGADAISLITIRAEAELRFTAANTDKVAIAPIDMTALAARSVPADSCRSTRDTYHQLLGDRSCQIDVDCRVAAGLALPGEPPACGVSLNAGAADVVAALANRWRTACIDADTQCPPLNDGGRIRCLQGRCTTSCFGSDVPVCAISCRRSPGGDFIEGSPCTGSTDCMSDDRRRCVCTGSVVTCASYPSLPDCPYDCLPLPDGGADAGTDS